MKQENEYFNDAVFFIDKVANDLHEELSYEDTLKLTLNFALGMERLLKGILYSLNPIYVFRDQDFKNTVSLLYKDKLLDNTSENKEISTKPNADVLAFKQSLLRAEAISEATGKYRNLLFALSNSRDIIAHQPLSLFNIESNKTLFLRDFYPLIRDYSKELGVPVSYFVSSNEFKLARISARYQDNIKDRMQIKLETYKIRWERRKIPAFIEQIRKKTKLLGQEENIKIVICPACENDSALYFEPEYDYIDREEHIVGIFISGLKCYYCGLEINDYEEIDFLDLDSLLYEEQVFLDKY